MPAWLSTRDQASVPEDPFPSVSDLVARWGHAVLSVGYGQCSVPGCNCTRSATPWTYSVGLCDLGQPELVMLGLEPDITQTIINVVADERRSGFITNEETSFSYRTGRFRIVDVPNRWVLVDPNRMASWFEHFDTMGMAPRS